MDLYGLSLIIYLVAYHFENQITEIVFYLVSFQNSISKTVIYLVSFQNSIPQR